MLTAVGRGPLKNIPLRIGILSLQGCVDPHKRHLESLGVEAVEVKRSEDFSKINGLILPGGESTTMLKLISHFKIWNDLKETAKKIPYWGVCAGSILMAKKVTLPAQDSLGLLDIEVERNAYGRQLASHEDKISGYAVSFIRAPVFKSVGPKCNVLAKHRGQAVWVTQGKHVVTTFHSELSKEFPSPFHKFFVDECKASPRRS